MTSFAVITTFTKIYFNNIKILWYSSSSTNSSNNNNKKTLMF